MAGTFAPEKRDEIIRKWVVALPGDRRALCKSYGISDSLPHYWRARGYFPKDLTMPPATPLNGATTSEPPPIPLAVTAGVPASGLTAEQRKDLGARFAALRPDERTAFAKTIGYSRSILYDWARGRKLGQRGGMRGVSKPPRKPPTLAGLEVASAMVVVPRKSPPYTVPERLAIKAEHMAAQAEGLGAVRAFGEKWGKPSWLYQSAKKLANTREAPSEEFKKAAVERIEALLASDPKRHAQDVVQQVIKELGKTMHWTSYYTWRKVYGSGAPALARPPAGQHHSKTKTHRTPDEKRAKVEQIDLLRAAGIGIRDACRKAGVTMSGYQQWKAGNRLEPSGHPAKNGALNRPLALQRPRADAVALSNRALQKANGGPRVESAVSGLIKTFVQELAAMGAEIQEIKNNGDGHCTVVVKYTESFKI